MLIINYAYLLIIFFLGFVPDYFDILIHYLFTSRVLLEKINYFSYFFHEKNYIMLFLTYYYG